MINLEQLFWTAENGGSQHLRDNAIILQAQRLMPASSMPTTIT